MVQLFAKKRKLSFRNTSLLEKITKVLNFFFVIFLFIGLRVWYLTVVQHEERSIKAKKPQITEMVEIAPRATIRDRFNVPLAINKIQYNATVYYDQIKQLPAVLKKGIDKESTITRKKYVHLLATKLSEYIDLDVTTIEDLIFSKSALMPHIPFVIKEDLDEKTYYELKAIEGNWPGLYAQKSPKRYYPQQRVAAEIIGYVGSINREEYMQIVNKLCALKEYFKGLENELNPPLPDFTKDTEEAEKMLVMLQEQAYSFNDQIGKMGVEAEYESVLRGTRGYKQYLTDAKGNFLQELSQKKPTEPGNRLILTISSELQEFAEKLLIDNEKVRDGKSHNFDTEKKIFKELKQPWIKTGAIVAMHPKTGEILAMASCPRFNPNDFIISGNQEVYEEKQTNIHRWLETEQHIADLWNRKCLLKREWCPGFDYSVVEQTCDLTWENYLNFVLPLDSPLKLAFQKVTTINDAIFYLNAFKKLMQKTQTTFAFHLIDALYEPPNKPSRYTLSLKAKQEIQEALSDCTELQEAKKKLDTIFFLIPHNAEKMFFIDLLALIVDDTQFSMPLLKKVGDIQLTDYRIASTALSNIQDQLKKIVKDIFHNVDFAKWRSENETIFLKEKRKEEKKKKSYQKPYLDYLFQKEQSLFESFWKENKENFLLCLIKGHIAPLLKQKKLEPYVENLLSWNHELSQGAHQHSNWYSHYKELLHHLEPFSIPVCRAYLKTMRSYQDLNTPLFGKYTLLKGYPGEQYQKHLAALFYPKHGFGYARSHAFRQATILGSIFKLVVAYEAARQKYYALDTSCTADELNPLTMTDQIHKSHKPGQINLGYFKDGTIIPRFYKGGRLPRSEKTSIGKIDLKAALETSSNPYFSIIASENIQNPYDLNRAALNLGFGHKTGIDLPGEYPGKLPQDLHTNQTGLYAYAIGQHQLVTTPLQTAVMLSALANQGYVLRPRILKMMVGKKQMQKDACKLNTYDISLPNNHTSQCVSTTCVEVQKKVDLPPPVQRLLLESMYQVIEGDKGGARLNAIHNYFDHLQARKSYAQVKNKMVGKTGTSEIVTSIDFDVSLGRYFHKDIGFGSIAYNQTIKEDHMAKNVFRFEDPDLVVVVYLRFGDFGKEAAPLAAQIIDKWKEIQKKYSVNNIH